MKIEIINLSKQKVVSDKFINRWIRQMARELRLRNIQKNLLKRNLSIFFVSESEIKKLNFKFRKKNKVTDILSFSSIQRPSYDRRFPASFLMKDKIGDLALCPRHIKKQALQQKIPVRKLTAYVILHGWLHLLGFEHEKSKVQEKKMMLLQDDLFKMYRS